ncbi:hypothetical protein NRB16_07840 [Pseudomonas sp. LJDD11]|uniref:hypothetical protein n=1 Tax=Pseudomonas sp. LJDD11 TaxID=2931984 RepID=UPI00211C56F5|nr:hypothetical protein [Pseudomonas sp. LJDD11]MCQ9423431.1 hypothetical protein [Pseudomonas sp. LJDD11]
MLSEKEFVDRAFAIAARMADEPEWAYHIKSVDATYIRCKSKKNLCAVKLGRMYPEILKCEPTKKYANPIIKAATNNQWCVNVPMREIVRRILLA